MDNKGNELVLGWRTNSNMHPRYWFDENKGPCGAQKPEDLVTVAAKNMAAHTAIIAQSGSGKSFFLGRLLEEILLRTRCRCFVLDPNADFRKAFKVEDESLWTNAEYNPKTGLGKLTHESTRIEFEEPWSKVGITVRAAENKIMGSADHAGNHGQVLKLNWHNVSVEFLSEDSDVLLRSQLYHCHIFTEAVGTLLDMGNYRNLPADQRAGNVFEEINDLLKRFRESEKNFTERIRLLAPRAEVKKWVERNKDLNLQAKEVSSYLDWLYLRHFSRAVAAAGYITEDAARFYFGKAHEHLSSGIIEEDGALPRPPASEPRRLVIIDLPSLKDDRTRYLAINSLVAAEWERARSAWDREISRPANLDERVPTFIVVDEAHNVIPAEPHNIAQKALKEQFRTIVAEGRKYGLFIILVTQRPDKLDPVVLSECENKVIMRLSSSTVLNLTKELLSLDDVPAKTLEKTLEFTSGCGLLVGKWAAEGVIPFYSAARRTVEGGRNLREAYWAVSPYESIPVQSSSEVAGGITTTDKKIGLVPPKAKSKKTVPDRRIRK